VRAAPVSWENSLGVVVSRTRIRGAAVGKNTESGLRARRRRRDCQDHLVVSKVGDGAELTRHRRAQRRHTRWSGGRAAPSDHLLKANPDREEDQQLGVPGLVVVLRVNNDPDADAGSCLGDFKRSDLDVGLPDQRLSLTCPTSGGSCQAGEDDKDDAIAEALHALQ
jgi:hypothetical protein